MNHHNNNSNKNNIGSGGSASNSNNGGQSNSISNTNNNSKNSQFPLHISTSTLKASSSSPSTPSPSSFRPNNTGNQNSSSPGNAIVGTPTQQQTTFHVKRSSPVGNLHHSTIGRSPLAVGSNKEKSSSPVLSNSPAIANPLLSSFMEFLLTVKRSPVGTPGASSPVSLAPIRTSLQSSAVKANSRNHPVLDALVTAYTGGSISSSTAILSSERLQRLAKELRGILATTNSDLEMIRNDINKSVDPWFQDQVRNFKQSVAASKALASNDVKLESLLPYFDDYIQRKRRKSNLSRGSTSKTDSPTVSTPSSYYAPNVQSPALGQINSPSTPNTTGRATVILSPGARATNNPSSTNASNQSVDPQKLNSEAPIPPSPSPKIKSLSTMVNEYVNESAGSINVKRKQSNSSSEHGGADNDKVVIQHTSNGPTLKIKLIAPQKPKTDNAASSPKVSVASGSPPKPKKLKRENSVPPINALPAAASASHEVKSKGSTVSSPQTMSDPSKNKIQNQVPIGVFWNYIESFFRPYTDEDMKFISSSSDDQEYMKIPTLGKHYKQVWLEEDGVSSADEISFSSKQVLRERFSSLLIKPHDVNDTEIRIKPEPKDDEVDRMEVDTSVYDDKSEGESTLKVDSALDPGDAEERLLSELKFAGLLSPADSLDSPSHNEDDEICEELRSLQRQLLEHQVKLRHKKAKVQQSLYKSLVHQEFQSVLEELEKQIELSFGKKKVGKPLKKPKRGKGHHHFGNVASATHQNQSAATSVSQLIIKRRNILKRFASIVPSKSEVSIPELGESVFTDSIERANAELSMALGPLMCKSPVEDLNANAESSRHSVNGKLDLSEFLKAANASTKSFEEWKVWNPLIPTIPLNDKLVTLKRPSAFQLQPPTKGQ